MATKFRRSKTIAPGVKLNFGKKSASITMGGSLGRVTLNTSGKVTKSASIPGTGLYYSSSSGGGKNKSKKCSNDDYVSTHRYDDAETVLRDIFGDQYDVICNRPEKPPFTLTSKDLIRADAMAEYSRYFGYDFGASKAACIALFEAAEKHIGQDQEAVMAFLALKDYQSLAENSGPCSCVVCVSKIIIATKDGVELLPILQISEPELDYSDYPMCAIKFVCDNTEYRLGVKRIRETEMLDCLKRSIEVCRKDVISAMSTQPTESSDV